MLRRSSSSRSRSRIELHKRELPRVQGEVGGVDVAYVCLLFAAVVVAPHFARINAFSYAINKRAIVAQPTPMSAMFVHKCKMASGIRCSQQPAAATSAASPPHPSNQTLSNTFACSFSRAMFAVVVGCLQQFRFGANFSLLFSAATSAVAMLLNSNFRPTTPTLYLFTFLYPSPSFPPSMSSQPAYLALV